MVVKAELYSNGESVPCSSISFTRSYTNINTLSFQSTEYQNDESQIRLLIDGKTVFGGQVQDVSESANKGFKHEVVDHSFKLNSPIYMIQEKKTVSTIAKAIAKDHQMKTSGITKTKKKHPKLAWENAKALDVMYQLANLEDKMRFYVNHDGIPVLEKIPQKEEGYVFKAADLADYSIDYSSSNMITGVMVLGKDSKELYDFVDKKSSAKYGVIREILNDSNITDKTTAKNKAQELFKEKNKKVVSAKIKIPTVLTDLDAGDYCAFITGKDSPNKLSTFFNDTVTTSISSSNWYQDVTLLDGRPETPDKWKYSPPAEKNKETGDAACNTTNSQTVTNPQAVQGSCGSCANKPAMAKGTVSFKDYCPGCKKSNVLIFTGRKGTSKTDAPEGQWTCKKCGFDACAKCGKEKISSSNTHLKKAESCTTTGSGTYSGSKGNLKEIAKTLGTPRAIFDWVEKHIKYELYCNNKYGLTSQGVIDKGEGNCYVQSQLVVDMFKAIGVSASRDCGRRCGKWPHCNVVANINGQKYRIDTACGKGTYKRIG